MSRVFLAFRYKICNALPASRAWNDGDIVGVPGGLNIRIPDRIANLFFNRKGIAAPGLVYFSLEMVPGLHPPMQASGSIPVYSVYYWIHKVSLHRVFSRPA